MATAKIIRAGVGGTTVEAITHGLDEAIEAARASVMGTVEAMGGALYREGLDIIADSKAEVPVKDGDLKSSGHVDDPKLDGGDVLVVLGFGGPSTPYALAQHERLDYRHDDGKAKYLEDPFNRHLVGMDERLAADIRRQAPR